MSSTDVEQDSVALGGVLLPLARGAIEEALGLGVAPVLDDPRLTQRGASFVTLKAKGELRGCIGSLNAHRPLGQDVSHNARGAAFHDSRFLPMTVKEWPDVKVEVSLLSEPNFLESGSEAQVLSCLRPGIDGVIFFNGCQKATFLPQVWEQLPQPRDFLAALKRKAGLAPDYWSSKVMVATYQVSKWSET
jgi:AmmeMemoRadiSam system protein A